MKYSYRELTALCISIGNYFLYDTVTEVFINFKVFSESPATWSVTGANNHSLVCHWLVWFVFPCCVLVVFMLCILQHSLQRKTAIIEPLV